MDRNRIDSAFLTVLFDDLGYIMDSEASLGRGYCDLSMIVRPDARRWGFLDQLIEFKHLELADLPDLDSEALAALPHEQLRARPEVHKLLAEAEAQLAAHCRTPTARRSSSTPTPWSASGCCAWSGERA